MSEDNQVPKSMQTFPNVSISEQTLEMLHEEMEYWQSKIDSATHWGAAYAAAIKFRDKCAREIDRRNANAKIADTSS